MKDHAPIRFSALGENASPPVIAQLMHDALSVPGILSLAAGFTDNAVLPREPLREAAETLLEEGAPQGVLQYGTSAGRGDLRSAAARLLGTYPGESALADCEDDVLITNGSQQGLYLLMQVLCNPGDIVLVDCPCYFVFLELLRGLRIEARSLPMQADGALDEAALERMLADMPQAERDRVKAVYLMGYYGNPSGRCWGEGEKRALGKALSGYDLMVPLIEDAAYRSLYFEEPFPARSILSIPELAGFPRVYADTLTKPFATGLKVGFLVIPHAELRAKVVNVKGHHDFGTSHFDQALLARCFETGAYAENLRRIRPHYAAKMRQLLTLLEASSLREKGWDWRAPAGGLLLWLQGPEGFDASAEGALCAECLRQKVIYVPGDLCFAEGQPRNALRLATGVLNEADLAEAVRRLITAIEAVSAPE